MPDLTIPELLDIATVELIATAIVGWQGGGLVADERPLARAIARALDLPARDAAVRIDERGKVRAELLARADLYERTGGGPQIVDVLHEAADLVAPEVSRG